MENNQERLEILNEADALYAKAKLPEALALYEEALATEESAWAHSRAGAILAQLDDYSAAETHLLRAIELDPRLPQAHSNLGNLYYARGDYESALAKYKTAVELDETNPTFHENLHAAYKRLGRLNEAVASLKQAHRVSRTVAKEKAREELSNMRSQLGRGKLPIVVVAMCGSSMQSPRPCFSGYIYADGERQRN